MTTPLFLIDAQRDNTPITADTLQEGWVLTLPESVRRHALQSMRLQTGDTCQITDGHGLRITATVEDPKAGTVRVESFSTEEPPQVRLALIQALAKNGHDEQAIDMATQIGVDDVYPWQADRSIARFKTGRTDKKWQQTLQAATEQSRRAYIPQLHDCLTSKQLLAQCRRASVHGDFVIVLHQDATIHWSEVAQRVHAVADRSLNDGTTRTIYVIVGPEGGITDQEIATFTDAAAEACVLGTNILRASTAGPVALSLLSLNLGRFA